MLIAPAEIVRTLASGQRPAIAHVAWQPRLFPVPAAADNDGSPLLLLPDSGRLAKALGEPESPALALRFDDSPPRGGPNWGSGWVCGWAGRLTDDEAHQAAIGFAERYPLPDLLDVGRGFGLWRLDIAEVRLERGEDIIEVCPDEFAAAEPDPWYGMEADLLHDVYDHHPEVLNSLRHRLSHVVGEARTVAPLRINRHGIVVEVHLAQGDRRRFFVPHHHDATRLRHILESMRGCGCTRESTTE